MSNLGSTTQTLFDRLLECRASLGRRFVVLEDQTRSQLSYNRLLLGSFMLGAKFKQFTHTGENTALLLPNVNAAVVSFFALQAIGRIPVMLNFSAGPVNLKAACETAQIRHIITSRQFIAKASLQDEIAALAENHAVHYLEDIRRQISNFDKLKGLLAVCFPHAAYARVRQNQKPNDPAVVLFTSGSEAAPKGVVLSHSNIIANLRQVEARVEFNQYDIMFNALPVFHSFGLIVGTLLPVLSGFKVFLYPSPLHYHIIPELIRATGATAMIATNTFYMGYARHGGAYDFHSLRYIIAGGEKLKSETRKLWREKFGKQILEGYGTTETSPVLANNAPQADRPGTVGRLLPQIEARLEPVPGINHGGRLMVRGPNIMKGYLKHDHPGVLQPPENGWHDTGDIAEIDDQGFVTILGRAKRFAKIGGEMVSLAALEELISEIWPEHLHAVVSLQDKNRGEQLILLTDAPGLSRSDVRQAMGGKGASAIMCPRQVFHVSAMPVLGTGKLDYAHAQTLAETLINDQ